MYIHVYVYIRFEKLCTINFSFSFSWVIILLFYFNSRGIYRRWIKEKAPKQKQKQRMSNTPQRGPLERLKANNRRKKIHRNPANSPLQSIPLLLSL